MLLSSFEYFSHVVTSVTIISSNGVSYIYDILYYKPAPVTWNYKVPSIKYIKWWLSTLTSLIDLFIYAEMFCNFWCGKKTTRHIFVILELWACRVIPSNLRDIGVVDMNKSNWFFIYLCIRQCVQSLQFNMDVDVSYSWMLFAATKLFKHDNLCFMTTILTTLPVQYP
jgi:hypothetical protein